MLTIRAPAKVNLALRVMAREESGFHQLETLFAALAFGDELTLERGGQGVTLDIDGPPMGSPEDNLVYRAARGFLTRGGIEEGVKIHLKKRIPMQAGLGGGSSDAAATLRAMDYLFPGAVAPEELTAMSRELGSDVPFFFSPSPLALAWGRGDRVTPLPPLPSAPTLLALPPVGMETPRAYGLLARHREETGGHRVAGLLSLEDLSRWEGVASFAANDFEDVIFPVHPLLGRLRTALQGTAPRFSLLSGSGSALFAVYRHEGEASAALDRLRAAFPETRFILTRTLERRPELPLPSGG